MKTCRRCGVDKTLHEFSPARRNRDGLASWCKPCASAATIASAAKRPRSALAPIKRRSELRRKFGITPEQYDAMLSDQGGVCAICGRACPSGKRLAVDHDHKTSVLRKLLCHVCNTTLGKFNDDPEWFEKAAAYLRNHR